MLTLKKLQYCTKTEQKLILTWRNHPFVRSKMIEKEIISEEAHLKFLENLKYRKDADYRLVKYNKENIGVIDLINIKNDRAELGLYKNPNLNRKGLGSLLMEGLFILASQNMINILYLRVQKENLKAINLYNKFGFNIQSEDSEYKYMEKAMNSNIFIVAELSANHNHDINIAKESILAIAEIGADAVKIQTYTADTITIDCDNEYFQIEKETMWDGRTLYELYQEAYTPWGWHAELRDYAESLGLIFFSTPFDFSAIDFLEEQNNPIYKIASFEITDISLIEYAASKGKPMIISTGIAEIQEIHDAVQACFRMGNKNITLLKCTSSYPAPIDQTNLKTMVNMRETFGVKVGLSDHSMGSDVALAAAALGATIIEKHFVLDRKLGGPDASFSMEPDEFKRMVKSIRNIEKAIGTVSYQLSEKTKKNREFSRSLFVVKDIKEGETFTGKNIRSIRPGNGLAPKYLNDVIGKKASINVNCGTPFKWSYINDENDV